MDGIFAKVNITMTTIRYSSMIPDSRFTYLETSGVY